MTNTNFLFKRYSENLNPLWSPLVNAKPTESSATVSFFIDSWDSVQLSTVLGALVAFWDEGKDFYLTFEGAFYDSQSQDGFHVSEFMTRVMEA